MKPASIVSRRAITLLCLVTIGGPVCADPIITTVAGGGPDDLPAVAATLNSPANLAVDGSGNLYVIASVSIFRITPNGRLFVHAGRGAGFAGDGGPARQANISSLALAADEAGNIVIADSHNRIRRVDASTGIITTIAGTGAPGFGGDGGPATSATFGNPIGVAIDHAGNVYFSADNRVRRIDAITGIVTTVAGTGALGYSGDGGTATAATFFVCAGLAFDGGGNLHVVDAGNRVIRRVDAVTGFITTVAGNGTQQAGGAGADGQPATNVGLFNPNAIALDANDNLFISDGNLRIRRVDAVTRIITTVAGGGGTFSDGVPATEASLSYPQGVAVDQAGHLYIGDATAGRIRKVDAVTGLIGTYAGGGNLNAMPDGLPATRLSVPILKAAAVDPWGNLYLMSGALLRIDGQTGRYATIGGAGTNEGEGVPIAQARLSLVKDLEIDTAGNLYVLEGGFYVEPGPVDPGGFFGRNRVRRIDAVSGLVTTVAGTGFFGHGAENVPATLSALGFPEDIALDAQGDLYITEGFEGMTGTGGNRVRRVSAVTGLINTIAGGGYPQFGGDGGPAIAAYLAVPQGLAVDRVTRDVYIADTGNARVRRIDSNTGIIDTVAGNGSHSAPVVSDGVATLTPIAPHDLAIDASGQVYIAEPLFTSARIWRLDVVAGLISQFAGTGVKGSWGDGGPALEAHIGEPHALAVDPDGNLLFVEAGQNRIRQVGLGGLSNRPPEASAGSDAVRGCAPSTGAEVTLDGSGSVDADSQPGGNDDIASFEWYEDFGRTTESLLGTGEELVVALLPGEHAITLRVEDRRGLSDLDDVKLTVLEGVDVDPPQIDLAVLPDRLWPPNHHLVDVTVSVGASDDCGAVAVVLESITSSEPEDAPGHGDGATHDDIQDADYGTADFTFRLRAERESGGTGRAYTIIYRATDESGKTATATAVVVAPHDMSGVQDPVRIDLRETPAGTLVLWDPVPGARFYNVVRGDLAGISATNEAIELGLLRCVEAGSTDTSTAGLEDAERPPPGASFFYLAEFDDGRPSTYGAPDAARPRHGSSGCDP